MASLSGQDIHFSQFETLASSLNPALTGFIPGDHDVRLAGIYRNQWAGFLKEASFTTKGIAFDMRNCFSGTKHKSFNGKDKKFAGPTWGLGFSYVRDESGVRSVGGINNQSSPLIRDHGYLSGSIIIPAADHFYLSGGFRFGGIFNRLETGHLRYDEQFDGVGGFDPNISGELDEMNRIKSNLFDIGGGVALFYLKPRWGANLGLAFDHVFVPVKYHFFDNDSSEPSLSRKITLHGKLSFILHKKKGNIFGVNTKILVMNQSPYQQIVAGTDLFFQSGTDLSMTLGAGLRSTRQVVRSYHVDAIMASTSLNYKAFTFQFNYDINTSILKTVSKGYGAFEFSLIYHWKKKNSKCSPALEGCKLDGKNVHPVFI